TCVASTATALDHVLPALVEWETVIVELLLVANWVTEMYCAFFRGLVALVSISNQGLSAMPPLKKLATACFTGLQVTPWLVDFDHTMTVFPVDFASMPVA